VDFPIFNPFKLASVNKVKKIMFLRGVLFGNESSAII